MNDVEIAIHQSYVRYMIKSLCVVFYFILLYSVLFYCIPFPFYSAGKMYSLNVRLHFCRWGRANVSYIVQISHILYTLRACTVSISCCLSNIDNKTRCEWIIFTKLWQHTESCIFLLYTINLRKSFKIILNKFYEIEFLKSFLY